MSDFMTSREYWQEIRDLARSVIEEAAKYDRDEYDVMHETIDGHQWVIYNYYHHQVLQHTDNEDAWTDFGEERPDNMAQVYCAMHQDVLDCFDDVRADIEAESEDTEIEA